MLEGTAVLWEEFQSTLPVRGATKPGIQRIRIKGISIHAPREGSDNRKGARQMNITKFQSTLPVRGATLMFHFLHLTKEFQSTLPVRGATVRIKLEVVQSLISIHAPREGSDSETAQRHRYVL